MKPFKPHDIRFRLRAFHSEAERPRSHRTLRWLLNTLTFHNMLYLRENPDTPLLYKSGVRYEEEPLGEEDWNDIAVVRMLGWGDCEDLACWRAAEINVRLGRKGFAAIPIWKWRRLSPTTTLYHIMVLVRFPDGHTEVDDPSKKLGMGRKPSQYAHLVQPMHAQAAGWLTPAWPHIAA